MYIIPYNPLCVNRQHPFYPIVYDFSRIPDAGGSMHAGHKKIPALPVIPENPGSAREESARRLQRVHDAEGCCVGPIPRNHARDRMDVLHTSKVIMTQPPRSHRLNTQARKKSKATISACGCPLHRLSRRMSRLLFQPRRMSMKRSLAAPAWTAVFAYPADGSAQTT